MVLEVADEPDEQLKGLMYRKVLLKNQGMYFPFNSERNVRFWMYKTLLNLDMIFLYQGRVISLEKDLPSCSNLPCKSYGPFGLIDGVIELAAGEISRLGISNGDEVKIIFLKNNTDRLLFDKEN